MQKILIIAVALALAVSPVFPRVFADNGSWKTPVTADVWDYDYFQVERLAMEENMQGPYQFNDVVFFTKTSANCTASKLCDTVDMTIFKNGKALEVQSVSNRVEDTFWHTAQNNRFIFFVPSPSDKKDSWGNVHEYHSEAGIVSLGYLARESGGVSFMTFATEDSRVYSSALHEDKKTHAIESTLSVLDYANGYTRSDITDGLTAPWQEIVDVQNGLALVKFQFEGGFKQLWIVNQTARTMEAIPETWTESNADIVGAHYLSDGSIRFFRNFKLWSYMPGVDEKPQDAGGAFLSWLMPIEEAVQISGDRMSYIDDENGLYMSDLRGVRKIGIALNGQFHLTHNALYFQNVKQEYAGYSFETDKWETRAFHVTDAHDDILVGIDQDKNVWYENTTNGRLLHLGFGGTPVLSDREHAYWLGEEGQVFEATFSPVLDLKRPQVEAFSSYTSDAVYLVSAEQMWLIPNEEVFYTWFDSMDEVVEVSQATINVLLEISDFEGDLKFAPGTRVKSIASPRVYLVGSDSVLHWIVSETVAHDIYGLDWNQGIIEVNDTDLWKYAKGSDVSSGSEVREI